MASRDFPLHKLRYALNLLLIVLAVIIVYQVIYEVKLASDEVLVQGMLRNISDTLETYHLKHGRYPEDITSVILEEYPYRLDYYFIGPYYGYMFEHDIVAHDYIIKATPVNADKSAVLMVRTGGEIYQAER